MVRIHTIIPLIILKPVYVAYVTFIIYMYVGSFCIILSTAHTLNYTNKPNQISPSFFIFFFSCKIKKNTVRRYIILLYSENIYWNAHNVQLKWNEMKKKVKNTYIERQRGYIPVIGFILVFFYFILVSFF